MQWSVVLQARGDRVLTLEEIVELADAVAGLGGVASGIGDTAYGVQIVVEAETRELAVDEGRAALARAAQTAGLPAWPVSSVEVVSPDDEDW